MFDYSSVFYSQLDYLLANQLPKPTPIYSSINLPTNYISTFQQHESVIKSTNSYQQNNQCIPKCSSPTIVCQSSDNKTTSTFSDSTDSKTTSGRSRRLSYTREYKLLVINYYLTNGQNKYRTCKQFHITKSMLNGWLQKAEKILTSRHGAKKTGSSGRRPQFPSVEEKLYGLYIERKLQGHEVENRWIKEMAKELAKEHNTCNESNKAFSERWLSNFKRRYNLKTLENTQTHEMNDEPIKLDKNTCNSLSFGQTVNLLDFIGSTNFHNFGSFNA